MQDYPLPLWIGHRGLPVLAPENTLESFHLAKQAGASMVEFDVQLSADGVPVVIHDDTLNRTTNGDGRVIDFTLHELRQLDLGDGEIIPTLEEVLYCLLELGLQANVEIKFPQDASPSLIDKTVDKTLALLNKIWSADQLPTLISSFNLTALEKVREHLAYQPIAILADHFSEHLLATAKKLDCISLNLNSVHLCADTVAYIKKHGFRVLCFTVDNLERAEELYRWGVDGVFTNDVRLFIAHKKGNK